MSGKALLPGFADLAKAEASSYTMFENAARSKRAAAAAQAKRSGSPSGGGARSSRGR